MPIAWAIAKGTLPIIGATKVHHVEDAAAAEGSGTRIERVVVGFDHVAAGVLGLVPEVCHEALRGATVTRDVEARDGEPGGTQHVALADALPEHREVDALPGGVHAETVLVARGGVTDDVEVAMVGQGIPALGNHAVRLPVGSADVQQFEVARPGAFAIDADAASRVIVSGLELPAVHFQDIVPGFLIRGEQPAGAETPDRAEFLARIVAVEGTRGIVVFREIGMPVAEERRDGIIEPFAGKHDPVFPAQRNLPPVGPEVGAVFLGLRRAENLRKGDGRCQHVLGVADIEISHE